MSRSVSKQKLFVIAFSMFLVTFGTIFLLIDKDKLNIEKADFQTHVLQGIQTDGPLNEDEYRKSLNNFVDDFVIVTQDRTVKFINKNLLDTHDYIAEDIEGVNILTFVHPKDLPELSLEIMEYHKTMEEKDNLGPVRIKAKSGTYKPYMVSLIPLVDNEGEMNGSAVILKDVSIPLGEMNSPVNKVKYVTKVDEEKDIVTDDNEITEEEKPEDEKTKNEKIDIKEEKANIKEDKSVEKIKPDKKKTEEVKAEEEEAEVETDENIEEVVADEGEENVNEEISKLEIKVAEEKVKKDKTVSPVDKKNEIAEENKTNNNGHGNNEDGTDLSNPGKTNKIDTSYGIDDEKK